MATELRALPAPPALTTELLAVKDGDAHRFDARLDRRGAGVFLAERVDLHAEARLAHEGGGEVVEEAGLADGFPEGGEGGGLGGEGGAGDGINILLEIEAGEAEAGEEVPTAGEGGEVAEVEGFFGLGLDEIVGAGIADGGTALAQATAALGSIPVYMASLSATGINFTLVIDDAEVIPAMQRLHAAFFGQAAS